MAMAWDSYWARRYAELGEEQEAGNVFVVARQHALEFVANDDQQRNEDLELEEGDVPLMSVDLQAHPGDGVDDDLEDGEHDKQYGRVRCENLLNHEDEG